MAKHFAVTEEHLKLLARLNVGWCGDEFGAPCVDPKRPYGNSDVLGDLAAILGVELGDREGKKASPQMTRLFGLHVEMETVLQILADNAGRGVRPGTYFQAGACEPWVRAC